MTQEEKMEIFKDAFSIDGDLDANTKLEDLDDWDSMSMLTLIVLFKDHCSKKLDLKTALSFKTIQDIFNAMN